MLTQYIAGKEDRADSGFTLIEMTIVLLIIGLIIGGILVGKDLITNSQAKAQIAQIRSYNTAAKNFEHKYEGLPGDLSAINATQYGFAVGTGCDGVTMGARNGDGLIEGWAQSNAKIYSQTVGETALFWEDLTDAGLIEGKYPNGTTSQQLSNGAYIFNCNTSLSLTSTQILYYFPTAKLGYNNYVYVYTDGTYNWFGVMQILAMNNNGGAPSVTPSIPVLQAYSIDKKIDDGSPVTGNVLANYVVVSTAPATILSLAPNTTTAGGNATSCYDTTTNNYSITVSKGNGQNCALSFKFE